MILAEARRSPRQAVLLGVRWGLLITWAVVLVLQWRDQGVPLDAQTLLAWIAAGLACACVGRRPIWLLWVVIDILPFAAVLLAYDRLRGFAYQVGLPGWWHPQIDVDKVLGFGHVPSVWLQEHLKQASVQWYDIAVCLVYMSYFFAPFVTAGVLWLRRRADFYRWSLRFMGLSLGCYALFVLIPCAPPWAAARCTPIQVADHPTDPYCINFDSKYTAHGGLLGPLHMTHAGAHPYLEATVYRGYGALHIKYFGGIIQKGHAYFDPLAAVPSLHVGATTLLVLFLWRRTPRLLRPLLALYPFAMAFTLVYTAEHYVTDCLLGAATAFALHAAADRVERRIAARRAGPGTPPGAAQRTDEVAAPDTLDTPIAEPPQESSCPPLPSVPATTPSST
ncbi:MAG: phosphatase PAP2 family protein [Jatrophihabitans sp.]|uniref:phosphatase PAP2 family protein n=1 Tax=Jatrophihabitans sp. TaxID=1932789 RepID=UPI003F7D548B